MTTTKRRMAVPKPVAKKLAIAADDAATQAEYDDSVDHKTVARLRMSATHFRTASKQNDGGEFVSVYAQDVARTVHNSTEAFARFRTDTITASLTMLEHYGLL